MKKKGKKNALALNNPPYSVIRGEQIGESATLQIQLIFRGRATNAGI